TDDIELFVAGNWSGPLGGVAAGGTLELSGTWPELAVAHELGMPFQMTTTGTLAVGPLRFDLVNEWQDLAWPGAEGIASPSGRLAVAGSFDDFRYEGTGTAEVLERATGFTVAGTGQRLLLALEALELAPAAPGGGT